MLLKKEETHGNEKTEISPEFVRLLFKNENTLEVQYLPIFDAVLVRSLNFVHSVSQSVMFKSPIRKEQYKADDNSLQ